MKSSATTPRDYLAELPDDRRKAISDLRAMIRNVAPGAVESIEYGMLSYALGDVLVSLGSQKAHMALYVCDVEAVDAHRERLGKLNCGKGCIRFRKLSDLPLDAVSDILKSAFERRKARQTEANAVGAGK
jgi:uncharacterized protein YdhG (YjbR/CyaY superfamily)